MSVMLIEPGWSRSGRTVGPVARYVRSKPSGSREARQNVQAQFGTRTGRLERLIQCSRKTTWRAGFRGRHQRRPLRTGAGRGAKTHVIQRAPRRCCLGTPGILIRCTDNGAGPIQADRRVRGCARRRRRCSRVASPTDLQTLC